MGIAAGGNINPSGLSMFEPIGGSAPKYTGLNVINPMAAICAGAMMLDSLGETKAAAAIETAVATITPTMKSQAAGRMGYSTTELGDAVVKALRAAAKPAVVRKELNISKVVTSTAADKPKRKCGRSKTAK